MNRQEFLNMKSKSFILTCVLFLFVRTIYAQETSPAGGGWYSFAGTDDSFLQVSDSDFLDTRLQDAFTIELWIYPKSLPKPGEVWLLLQKVGSYDIILTNENSSPWIGLFNYEALVREWFADLKINQWTHIALNFQQTVPPIFKWLFANGKWRFAADTQERKYQLLASDSPLTIGRRFDGLIDEVHISKIVRYENEFAPSKGRFEPDEHTMALWHFDGTGAAVFADASGNGNHVSGGTKEQVTWRARAPMPTPRTEMSAIAVGKKIYVFGGFGLGNRFTVTEIYDTETDSWHIGAPMPEHTNHAGIGVVNGKIYIIGGGNTATASCWEYDPVRDKWSRKADMKHQRWALWVAELNGKLYAIGGQDGGNEIAPIEVYDPMTDTWEERASLPNPRDHLVVAAVNGKIYAIGGRNSHPVDNLVHEYDPRRDLWQQKAPMPTSRSGMMVASIRKSM